MLTGYKNSNVTWSNGFFFYKHPDVTEKSDSSLKTIIMRQGSNYSETGRKLLPIFQPDSMY